MNYVGALDLREPRTLTAAIMVMFGSDGLRIPGLDTVSGQATHGPIPLGFPELILLTELRRGRGRTLAQIAADAAEQTGSRPEALHAVLDKLSAHGLLRTAAQARPEPASDPVAADANATARFDPAAVLGIATPRLFRIADDRFEHIDHDGRVRARLSAIELLAASEFRQPLTVHEAFESHRIAGGPHALDQPSFERLTGVLGGAGLLECIDPGLFGELGPGMRTFRGRPSFGKERAGERDWQRFQALNARMREHVRAGDAQERAREAQTGRKRVKVVSVQHNGTIAPLALGMIVAAAKAYDGGRLDEHYYFHPDWLVRPSKVRSLTNEPGIFLFSNYNWSHRHNMLVSRKVKELSPHSITIHGGPNTPKYEADCEAYFRANPDVDVTVRGEGEATVCELLDVLSGVVGNRAPDLAVLRSVAGISLRDGDRIVHTPDRERIVDLESIPSPILTGLFDAYAGTELAIVETNRGCPYSCAFCDWGSAIATRIRQFSIERVFAELEWCAQHDVAGIMCADANFGIFPRDVEIAEKIAQLKAAYGFPNGFSVSAAKNTTKHTKRIIEILADAGVMSKGSIGVQSTDPDTLATIQRSNIKVEAYDQLAIEFRKAGLPLWVDLMFGLPGQTTASFQNDLQGCIDRGVFPRMFMTELLINSPMNAQSYRDEHRIKTELSPDGSRNLVVSTATFTREEYEEMNSLRLLFLLCDVVGMLRHVSHYVRSETGMREIDFYERLRRDITADPERWPTLAFSVRALPGLLVPPVSWYLAVQEARRYVVEMLQIPDDDALGTVIAVQHAVLPARDRVMPLAMRLPHDYAAWHQHMVAAAQGGGRQTDWQLIVPKLREFGPAPFVVDDPDKLCTFGIGAAVDGDLYGNYELRSPVARWTRPAVRPPAETVRSA
ncbi:MAG: radical SAM protein [Candidatus Eremiobacteraeota bacterium]|nr:radical SAM protein [Candidatus Eremiobacteraeota bacterium]